MPAKGGAAALPLAARLQLLVNQILAPAQLERVIAADHLDAQGPVQGGLDQLTARMREQIRVEPLPPVDPRARLQPTSFQITYTERDPRLAAKVASALADLFLERHRAVAPAAGAGAPVALALTQAARQRSVQEDKLRAFIAAHPDFAPDRAAADQALLSALEASLAQASQSLHQAEVEAKRVDDRALALVAPTSVSSPAAQPHAPLDPLKQRLTDLKAQLARLRTRYTEQYPDVQRLEREINAVQALRARQAAASRNALVQPSAAPTSGGRSRAALAAQLKTERQAGEREVALRNSQIAQLEGQVAQVRNRIQQAPLLDRQWAELSGAVAQAQSVYQEALARVQAAQAGAAALDPPATDSSEFRLLEPPTPPRRPYFPNPLLFSAAGLLIGLALGLNWAALRERRGRRIHAEQQAAALCAAPLLPGIPPLLTRAERRRQAWLQLLHVTSAALMVGVIAAANLALYWYW